MKKRTTLIIGALVLGGALAGGGLAIADNNSNDADVPITDATELQRATDAALAFTGAGEVTETEEGDEESMYEVEVRLPNGDEIDVQLDENFEVVGSETDGPGDDGDDHDEGADDADGD